MNITPDHRLFRPSMTVQTEHGLFNPHGDFDAANERLCRVIGEKLAQHYPGHPWAVFAEIEHGIAKIALQGFTQWPYVIKISTLKADPGLRIVVKAGGELLERLKMPRGGFSLADWKSATTIRPWHFNRNKKAPE